MVKKTTKKSDDKSNAAKTRKRLTKSDQSRIDSLIEHSLTPEQVAFATALPEGLVSAYITKRVGRPTIAIKSSHIDQIKALAGFGMSMEKIAASMGISRGTLYNWRSDERVLDAIEQGRAVSEAQVGRSLFNRAVSGEVPAIVWYEKTRTGRSDRMIIENKVREEISDFFEFLGRQLDEDTFTNLLSSYNNEFCSGITPETEAIPEVYR